MSHQFPQQKLDEIEPSAVQHMVTSLRELHQLGRPQTDEQVESRIDEYFSFCERSSVRPGVESLCLSLHITRQTLYNWCAGVGCSERRQQACQSAKSFIAAYVEQASMSGRINPATAIFLQKNWFSYRDTVSFEEVESNQSHHTQIPRRTAAEIAAAFGISEEELSSLPEPEKPEI